MNDKDIIIESLTSWNEQGVGAMFVSSLKHGATSAAAGAVVNAVFNFARNKAQQISQQNQSEPAETEIQYLKRNISKCNGTDNPQQCRQQIMTKIKSLEDKAREKQSQANHGQ